MQYARNVPKRKTRWDAGNFRAWNEFQNRIANFRQRSCRMLGNAADEASATGACYPIVSLVNDQSNPGG
jgi:hypothetical protein